MKTLGNILWFIFVGLWEAIGYFFLGLIWCITIVGIPFGLQAFKLAKLIILPFGKEPKINFNAHPIANIIWMIFGGIELALGFVIGGVILCITIIGIPFGKQCFKLAALGCVPFGAKVD